MAPQREGRSFPPDWPLVAPLIPTALCPSQSESGPRRGAGLTQLRCSRGPLHGRPLPRPPDRPATASANPRSSAPAAVSFFLAPLFDLDSMIPGGRTPAPRPAQRPPRHGRSAPLRPSRSPPRAGAAPPSPAAAARARVCLCTQPILLAVLFEVLCAQQALRSSAAELRLLQQRRRRRRRPPALPPPTPSHSPLPAPRPTVIPI